MLAQLKKWVAGTLVLILTFSFLPMAEAQQATTIEAQNQQTFGVSPENTGNPDVTNHCGESGCDLEERNESPLSAMASSLPSQNENRQSLYDGLRATLPSNYTLDIVNESGVEKLKISYSSTKAQTAGTLTSLSVTLNSAAANKFSVDMSSLSLSYKGTLTSPSQQDVSILREALSSALETGLVRNSGAGIAAENSVINPRELYEVLALSQMTVASAKTTGTASVTRTINFKAEGIDFVGSQKDTLPIQASYKSANISASANYILGLQDSVDALFGQGTYRVNASAKVGEVISVRIERLTSGAENGTIQRIEFSIKGANLETKPAPVFFRQDGVSVGIQASDMLRDAGILFSAGSSSQAFQHLLNAKINSIPPSGTANAAALLTYEKDGRQYEVKYSASKKDWIVQDITDRDAMAEYVLTTLRNHLANTNLKVEIVSISPQGIYDIKISSLLKTIPAKNFSSMTFKLEMNNGNIEMVPSSFAANFKGITVPAGTVADFNAALFASFGVDAPGQSPVTLSAITSFEDKIKAVTQVSILKTYDPKVNRFSFTLQNRDYEVSYARGSTPPVFIEEQTDLRYILPLEASVKKIFPGTIITRTLELNGNYKFSIVDTTTKLGEVKTIDFYVRVNYDGQGLGSIEETTSSFYFSYNGINGGSTINQQAAKALRDAIGQISNKTNLIDVLTALSTAKLEMYDPNASKLILSFGGKRYEINSSANPTDVMQVFDVKLPALALWKSTETLLNAVLPAAGATIQAEVLALKTELLKTGGNILSSMDREGSVYIQFFSNVDGKFTTLKIQNDPRNQQKTLIVSHEQLTEMSAQQAQLYLENMVIDKETTRLAADIKSILTNNSGSRVTLQRVNGLSVFSGQFNSKPFTIFLTSNQTIRIFAAAKAPTAMPALATGMLDAKKAFEAVDDYFGHLSSSDLVALESLRSQIYSTSPTVKWMSILKAADGTLTVSWFNDRTGTNQSLTLSTIRSGTKVLFGGIFLSTSAPLTSGPTANTLPLVELYLKNFGTSFLDRNTNKTTTLATIITNLKNANLSNDITVEMTAGGIVFKRISNIAVKNYTISISSTGAVQSWLGEMN